MKNTSLVNTLKKHPYFLLTGVFTLIIWITGLNGSLFLLINAQYHIFPTSFWVALNTLSDPKNGILPLILLVACCLRREKLLNIVILILAYYVIFQLLKTVINSPRPYMVFKPTELFWIQLPHTEFSLKAAMRSFPSGHAGEAAIFVFGSIHLWAENKRWLRVLLITFLILVMLARICTGWHFPLDTLVGALLGFVLTEICWYLPISLPVRFCLKTRLTTKTK